MLHRLTALVASLVLLPSMLVAGRLGCVVGEREPTEAARHAARHHHTDAHAPSNVASDETDAHGPADHVPAPGQCAAAMTCGLAVVAIETTSLDDLPHAANPVVADVPLAPDSPALGLEPPPPRG